jgi:hypothetical protein
LPPTTELTGFTLYPSARVRDTLDSIADTPIWAPNKHTCVRDALSLPAAIGGVGTIDPLTEIDADVYVLITDLTRCTDSTDTGRETGVEILITLVLGTETFRCAAITTSTFNTDLINRAQLTLIELAITVIVDSIASLNRLITAEATRVREPFIDETVTVIVNRVTYLIIRLLVGDTHDLTIDAALNTSRANPWLASRAERTRLTSVYIFLFDARVAVVINPIT